MSPRSMLCRFAGISSLVGLCLCAAGAGAVGFKKKPAGQQPAMGESAGQEDLAAEAAGEEPRPAAALPAPSARRSTPAERIAAEERKHLRRTARINRIQAIGIETANQALVELARELRGKETERHELARRRLQRELDDAAVARGGDR
jgi:hypothetical protein